MGDSPQQVQAPQDSPEARRLAELQGQRLEVTNALEIPFLQATTPLQQQLTEQQFGGQIASQPLQQQLQQQGLQSQLGLQPGEAQLRGQELATAGQRQGVAQGLLGGTLPDAFSGLNQALSPVELAGLGDEPFAAAQARIGEQTRLANEQTLAQQNALGILTSGGSAELLRRNEQEGSRQLADLAGAQAIDETARLQQQALLERQGEQDLNARQGSLLNLGLGVAPFASQTALQPGASISGLNPLGGAQSAFQGAASGIQALNAQQLQNQQFQQQLGLSAAGNQNAFFGDIIGGLLGGAGLFAGLR